MGHTLRLTPDTADGCLCVTLLDTSVSSVYREIKRNQGLRGYTAAKAQEICDIQKERYCLCRKFTGSMERHIRDKLTTEQWSPQQIVGHAGLHGIMMVSHERIYQFIRKDKSLGGNLWKHTRHQLKHRKRPVPGKQIYLLGSVMLLNPLSALMTLW